MSTYEVLQFEPIIRRLGKTKQECFYHLIFDLQHMEKQIDQAKRYVYQYIDNQIW